MAAFSVQAGRVQSAALPTGTVRADFQAVVLAAAVCSVVAAALILLGWAFDVTTLKTGIPGESATQPWTAVCFLVCGASLGLSLGPRGPSALGVWLGALAVLCFVALTFWQNALDTDWGLDKFFFTDAVQHEQTGQYLRPGRPAAGILIAIALGAACLLLVRATRRLPTVLYVWFSTVGALFTVTILLAHAFSLRSLYAMGFYAQIGLNSGICLAVLFAGLLLRRPELGWMRILTGDDVGGTTTRRLLMWTVSLLIVLTVIVQLGTAESLYGAELEVTLITVVGIALLFAGLLSHARRLNRLEESRRGIESELMAAEQQLSLADRQKDEFLAILAHELRNPLAPLRNGIEIVRQMGASDRTLARTVEMMSRQMNHLVRLVDDLLDISLITQGDFHLRRQTLDLREIVERGVDSCKAFIAAMGHEVAIEPSMESVRVWGDPNRLVQVIHNLLSNSAKYTARGGRIVISVWRDREEGIVSVTDTGVGIAPESLEAVFDMFSRVRTGSGNTEGLGIGLGLARSLVEMHGGSLTATSEGHGKGSVFFLRLPAIASGSNDQAANNQTSTLARTIARNKLRVLVADDNADAAASLALLLELGGHHVETVNDGRRAVELTELFQPDFIFMDLGMPLLSGVDAAREIRAHPWGRNLRIVALTGWGQDSERQRTQDAGIDLHLVKPVDPRALADILSAGKGP